MNLEFGREKIMSKARIKPRWKVWENACIKEAFKENVQLKVIAAALGRSMTAVSKKIKKLELRKTKPIQESIKGGKNHVPWVKKTSLDTVKMREILQTYAP